MVEKVTLIVFPSIWDLGFSGLFVLLFRSLSFSTSSSSTRSKQSLYFAGGFDDLFSLVELADIALQFGFPETFTDKVPLSNDLVNKFVYLFNKFHQ